MGRELVPSCGWGSQSGSLVPARHKRHFSSTASWVWLNRPMLPPEFKNINSEAGCYELLWILLFSGQSRVGSITNRPWTENSLEDKWGSELILLLAVFAHHPTVSLNPMCSHEHLTHNMRRLLTIRENHQGHLWSENKAQRFLDTTSQIQGSVTYNSFSYSM